MWWIDARYRRELLDLLEEHGFEVREHRDAGAPPPPPPGGDGGRKGAAGGPGTGADPYRCLWLLPQAPFFIVQAVYRALVKKHHPDQGGDAEKMRDVNLAYQKIEQSQR